jgi:hypothetical protein
MENEISNACQVGFMMIRNRSPIDTGNLRFNAIRYAEHAATAAIFVDEKVAPYMKYTNEHWSKFRPPLYGKLNPNYMWWNDAVVAAIYGIANVLNGEVIKV